MTLKQKIHLFLSFIFFFFAFASLIILYSKDTIFLGVLLFFNCLFHSYNSFVTAMSKKENDNTNQ